MTDRPDPTSAKLEEMRLQTRVLERKNEEAHITHRIVAGVAGLVCIAALIGNCGKAATAARFKNKHSITIKHDGTIHGDVVLTRTLLDSE